MINARTIIPPARAFTVLGADGLLNFFTAYKSATHTCPFSAAQSQRTSVLNLRELSSSWLAARALRRKEKFVRARLASGQCAAQALGDFTESIEFVDRIAGLRGSQLLK